jgi:hypothetical protein
VSKLRCMADGSGGAERWACRAVHEVDVDAVCELDRACYGEKVRGEYWTLRKRVYAPVAMGSL